jgi:hypothetical protein
MDAPERDDALGRLAWLIEKLTEALPKALYQANLVFENGDDFEPCVCDTHVRWRLKAFLNAAQIDAEYEDEETITTIPHSNCGLELLNNGLRVKINKGDSLPKPRTKRQSDFYSQQTDPIQLQFAFSPPDEPFATMIGNVVFLWSYDVETRTQICLNIVCPVGGADVREVWRHEIAVPAFVPPVQQSDEHLNDLPIFVDDEDAAADTPYFAIGDQMAEIPPLENLGDEEPGKEAEEQNDAS